MATVIPSICVYSGDEPGRHSQMGDKRPIPVRETIFPVKHQLTEGGSLPKHGRVRTLSARSNGSARIA